MEINKYYYPKSSRALLTRQRAPSSTPSSYHSLGGGVGDADGRGQGGTGGGEDGGVFPHMTEHVRRMFDIIWGPVLAVFGEVGSVVIVASIFATRVLQGFR